jgi:hypothetical protein
MVALCRVTAHRFLPAQRLAAENELILPAIGRYLPLLTTDEGGDTKATLPPSLLRSQGCFKWSHSKRYTFIRVNSIMTNCFRTLQSSRTR